MSEMEDPEVETPNDDFEEQGMTNIALIPTLVLLDVSGSMSGQAIKALNKALEQYKQEIGNDFKTKQAIDISIVTFGDGDATVEQEFTSIEDWTPSELSASGGTPMCKALIKGVSHMEDYRSHIDDSGTPLKKGLVWVLTDGKPTDDSKAWKGSNTETYWDKAKTLIEQGAEQGDLLFYFVGIGPSADIGTLDELADAAPDPDDPDDVERAQVLELKDGMFQEFFEVMTESQRAIEDGDDPDVNVQD